MRRSWILSLTAFAILGEDRLILTARGLANPVSAIDRDGNILVAGLGGLYGRAYFTPCLAGESCSGQAQPLAGTHIYVGGYTGAGERRLFELTFPAADAWTVAGLLPVPDGGFILAAGTPERHIVRRYDQRQGLRWSVEIPGERLSLGYALRPNGDVIFSGSRAQGNLAPLALILGRISPEGQVERSPLNIGGTRLSIAPDGSVLMAGQAIGGADQAFPATPGALQPMAPFAFCGSGFLGFPCVHQFVAHVSADLRTLKMATFLTGNRGATTAGAPVLLPDGSIAVAGTTTSSDYPTTPGAWVERFPSRVPLGFRGAVQSFSGFISVLSGDGRELRYSTFVGGPGAASLNTAEMTSETLLRLSGNTSTNFAGLRGRTADCAPYDARLTTNAGSVSASFEMEFDLAERRLVRSKVRPLHNPPGSLRRETRLVWQQGQDEVSSLTLTDVALVEPAPAIHCVEEPALALPQADQLAPGQLVALFGAGWPIAERRAHAADATELPRTLAGVRILGDGAELPLIYVSPEQINFAVPSSWAPGERKRIELEVNGERLAAKEFTVVPPRPALFQNVGNLCYFPTALAVSPESGEVYDCPSPAPREGVVSLFLQGIGLNTERQRDGMINRETDVAAPVAIEGGEVELVSVTPAIGQAAGMWQVQVRLKSERPGVARFPLRIGGEVREAAISIR